MRPPGLRSSIDHRANASIEPCPFATHIMRHGSAQRVKTSVRRPSGRRFPGYRVAEKFRLKAVPTRHYDDTVLRNDKPLAIQVCVVTDVLTPRHPYVLINDTVLDSRPFPYANTIEQ